MWFTRRAGNARKYAATTAMRQTASTERARLLRQIIKLAKSFETPHDVNADIFMSLYRSGPYRNDHHQHVNYGAAVRRASSQWKTLAQRRQHVTSKHNAINTHLADRCRRSTAFSRISPVLSAVRRLLGAGARLKRNNTYIRSILGLSINALGFT